MLIRLPFGASVTDFVWGPVGRAIVLLFPDSRVEVFLFGLYSLRPLALASLNFQVHYEPKLYKSQVKNTTFLQLCVFFFTPLF